MITRKYGRHDDQLSVVGFGGICVMNETPSDAARMVGRAVDRGITYFDVAPSYGNAQERLGPALEPYRKDVFLACKTGQRMAAEAQTELEESLRLLRTDYVDLYQFHGVTTADDVQQILGPGGALEVFLRAREKGQVRYLGLSAHSEEAFLELAKHVELDSVLFPVNWVCWYQGQFGPRVVEVAKEKGIAVLVLKTLAKRKWAEGEERTWAKAWYCPVESPEEAEMAVRFTLSQPVTAITSPGHEELLWWACDAADRFTPMSDQELKDVEEKSRGLAPIFSNQETRWEE